MSDTMMAKVTTMIEQFQDDDYLRYLEMIKEALTTSSLQYDAEGRLLYQDEQKRYAITMPKYKRVSVTIDENNQRISHLYNKYAVTKDKKIGKEIQVLSDENELLHTYYHMINKIKYDGEKQAILQNVKQLEKEMKKRSVSIKQHLDLKTQKEELDEQLFNLSTIEFYIVEQPIIEMSRAEKAVKPTKAAKATKVKEERQQKIKEKVVEQIVSKFPLNKFKFKSMEECTTKQRSNPLYISKEELITTIENDNDLKAIFPKNFKKLKKEDICEIIFRSQKI